MVPLRSFISEIIDIRNSCIKVLCCFMWNPKCCLVDLNSILNCSYSFTKEYCTTLWTSPIKCASKCSLINCSLLRWLVLPVVFPGVPAGGSVARLGHPWLASGSWVELGRQAHWQQNLQGHNHHSLHVGWWSWGNICNGLVKIRQNTHGFAKMAFLTLKSERVYHYYQRDFIVTSN